MSKPKKGLKFTHKSFCDPLTRRRKMMRITAVCEDRVYYTYATDESDKGAFYLDRDVWMERYGE